MVQASGFGLGYTALPLRTPMTRPMTRPITAPVIPKGMPANGANISEYTKSAPPAEALEAKITSPRHGGIETPAERINAGVASTG